MPSTGPPLVSLVIPARNESRDIGSLLESIIGLDYPCDRIDVIIVDAMSQDGTGAVAESYRDRLPRLRVIPNQKIVTPAGFNVGIQAAEGDLIGILSAHSTISSNYVSATVTAFHRLGADCVGGRIVNVGTTYWGRVFASVISTPIGVGNATFRYGTREERVDTLVGTYKREVFARIGLFDERLVRNQDNEFNARLRRAGGIIYLIPEITFYYHVRSTLGGAMRQFFRNGQWVAYTSALHPSAMSARHWAPLVALVVFAGMLAAALVRAVPLALPQAALCIYSLCLVVGLMKAARRLSPYETPGALVMTPLVHLSYAVGTLYGFATVIHFRRSTAVASSSALPPRAGGGSIA